MTTPFVSEAKSKDHNVLIVDKYNQFSSALIKHISPQATVVLVSEKKLEHTSVIHVPFTKRVPEIPEGKYAHIFLVSEEHIEHELLAPLAQKAQQDNAKLVYVTPYWLYKAEVVEKIAHSCRKWVVALIGDLFGTKDENSHIDHMLGEGRKKHSIKLPELGLETFRPVASSDAEENLLRIGFGFETGTICFIFPKHPFTALSLVHALQKIDPTLRIDFVNKEHVSPAVLLSDGVFVLPTDYPVLKKLQDVYTAQMPVKSVEVKGSTNVHKSKMKRSIRIPIFSLIAGMMFFLLLPLIWTYTALAIGGLFLGSARSEIEKGNFTQAKLYTNASEHIFQAAMMGSQVLLYETQAVNEQEFVIKLSKQLQSAEDLVQVVSVGIDSIEAFQQVAKGRSITPDVTFLQGVNALKTALLGIQQIDQNSLPESIKEELIKEKPLLTMLGQTVDVLPELFGIHSVKTYAILFQDNTELRPGGGRIAAYAIITLKKGTMGKVTIYSALDADNQLKGHVEPPFVVRRYLEQQHWYLRDSNISADNTKNAQNAAFFLQQETGVKVDGVITTDLNFIKELITAVGSVDVSEYNETVTEDTFFSKVESHAQKGSSTENTQKNDFLTACLSALQAKLQMQKVSYLDLSSRIIDAVQQKHLLFSFADPSMQQVFTVNNFSSALWDPRKQGQNTLNDFVAVNEVNTGNNKENAFVTRSLSQVTNISPAGTISGQLTIHYTNASDGSWPGGIYKNYVRILLPAGATLTNVLFNTVPQSRFPAVIDPKVYEAKTFTSPNGVEVEHTQEGGREVYGFLITVPVKSSLDVSVAYNLSQSLDLTQQLATYDMLVFKQPGTDKDVYTQTVIFPNSLNLMKSSRTTQVADGKVMVISNLATDLDTSLTFIKK